MFYRNNKAFTIVEVIVTISIVTILSSVALLNYYTFNDRLSLSSAGQEMAIAVRQAQSYGLNVRQASVGGGNFSSAYGITFDPGDPSNYYIFADTNANKRYDVGNGCGSANTECREKITIRNGVTITSIASTGSCTSTNPITMLHVTFIRPNPDAKINFTNGGGMPCQDQPDGQVILTSKGGRTLTLSIEITGQVSVQ